MTNAYPEKVVGDVNLGSNLEYIEFKWRKLSNEMVGHEILI